MSVEARVPSEAKSSTVPSALGVRPRASRTDGTRESHPESKKPKSVKTTRRRMRARWGEGTKGAGGTEVYLRTREMSKRFDPTVLVWFPQGSSSNRFPPGSRSTRKDVPRGSPYSRGRRAQRRRVGVDRLARLLRSRTDRRVHPRARAHCRRAARLRGPQPAGPPAPLGPLGDRRRAARLGAGPLVPRARRRPDPRRSRLDARRARTRGAPAAGEP